ncbi:hypothetical protein [Natronoarchaeum philippinense]|uniref:hypothetical protein n=1 Tax=Natronoarchaeum philippinense TaxID=558529 RepID=UPI000BE43C75|nr:hypothetical protein [Natronoarchaeum philippinense]
MPEDKVRKVGLALRVGSRASVEEVAEEHEVSETDVRDAVEWAAEHPAEVREIIEERAESLADLEREYPDGVDPPREQSAADYRERQLDALDAIVEQFE